MKRKKQVDNAFKKKTAAAHTAFAIGTALLKQKWKTSVHRQKQLVVSGFCFVFLVWGFFSGGLNSLGFFLPFIVLQCLCS